MALHINNNKHFILTPNPALQKNELKSSSKQVADSFEKMMQEVNNDQLKAESKVRELVAGKNKDVPGAVMAMEKADISLRLLLAVRNKIVGAYEEIMRMQV